MILVDYNQVLISSLMAQPNLHKEGIDKDLIRHMVLNSIRMYRNKFYNRFGEVVVCCDNRNYWRKIKFPQYKAHRKKLRETSDHDWNAIFECLNSMKAELKKYFPYKVLEVCTAEADDVIGTLCENLHDESAILILSGDKDFMQLQRYAGVEQYSPILKRFLRCPNPERFLKEHIMRGDKGDGVPNFLSTDDTFVTDSRQTPLSKKKIESWVDHDPEIFCTTNMLRNYARNQLLVDLTYVPKPLKTEIMEQYNQTQTVDRSKLFPYFIDNRLKNLMEHIGEF